MFYDEEIKLEPTFELAGATAVSEGDEVYVRGIGDKLLGIGSFAGSLVLSEPSGARVTQPIIEVQGRLVSGGEVDLWSPRAELIEAHRKEPTYPIADYINEIRLDQGKFQAMVDAALAAEIGVALE